MLTLKKITNSDFIQGELPIIFSEVKGNHNYAILSNGISEFRLAWQSDLIDPVVLEINPDIYCIGVDQHFAIVDFNNKSIMKKIDLTYNLLDIKKHKDWIFIFTELEILKIDRSTFKVLMEYALPDIFQDVKFADDVLKINCSGGLNIILKVADRG